MTFDEIIKKKKKKKTELDNAAFRSLTDKTFLKEMGIYVFYENEIPVYIGRTNNIKQRLKNHLTEDRGYAKATFAFLKAAKKFNGQQKLSRKEKFNDPDFKQHFLNALDEISQMKVKFINIDNQEEQHILEIFFAMEYKTEYNTFKNH